MRMEDTYFVNRHGSRVWLSCGVTPRIDDFIIEIRPMLIADPGKVLVKGDEIIGKAIWSRTGIEGFIEIDEPVEECEDMPEDGESTETEEPIEEEPIPEEIPVEETPIEETPIEEPAAEPEPIQEEPSEDEQTFRIV